MTGSSSDATTARRRWLCPSATGSLALVSRQAEASLWDAAATAHLLRFVPHPSAATDPFAADAAGHAHVLLTLAHGLKSGSAPLPELTLDHPEIDRARSAAIAALRSRHDRVPAGLVAAVVRLTALGFDVQPHAPVEEPFTIAARLARKLGLPTFVDLTLTTLALPLDDAVALGAPDALARAVRRALNHGHAPLVPPEQVVIDRPRLAHLVTLSAESLMTPADPADGLAERAVRRIAAIRSREGAELRDAKLSALAEFAAGASHEINNPLAIIRGNAELLLRGEPEADRQRQLRTIVAQTTRVHDLLQGTRSFARPPQPRLSLVDLTLVVRGVLDHHELDARRKQVELRFAEPAGPVWTRVDCGQLTQALSHVVKNAWEASPERGTVEVRLHPGPSNVELTVEDSGPGPEADAVPHLFDPFYSGREAGRGRGLGLSIAWRLVQLNGGKLDYTPTTGGPTRFTLTLPRAKESEERRAA